uniref:Multifunctional methyltransferase subunit TRM112-like protein n=1 Tax=Timema cristinae TaxID=61476 RepID=A0A7R9CPR3_TIMCR|nr:unnamed protein product [Timema cristinae]
MIMAKDVQVSEIDFNPEFLVRIIPKLDWSAFYKAAESHTNNIRSKHLLLANALVVLSLTAEDGEIEVRISVEVIDGELICPESGRKFPINEGIPNMLLNEDEL